jgi:hypothetical protein
MVMDKEQEDESVDCMMSRHKQRQQEKKERTGTQKRGKPEEIRTKAMSEERQLWEE